MIRALLGFVLVGASLAGCGGPQDGRPRVVFDVYGNTCRIRPLPHEAGRDLGEALGRPALRGAVSGAGLDNNIVCVVEKEIIAVDAEGAYHMHKIPVLDLKVPVGAKEAAEAVPPVLKNYKAVMVRSHGVFATGSILEEAYMWVNIVDSITRLRYLALQAGYKDEHKDYEKW